MPKPKTHYEPVKAYVPVNLPDIDHLDLPGSTVGLNPDRVRAIYHLLYLLRGKGATNDKYNCTDSFKQGWINVSSTLLIKVATRAYNTYLDWMEANGLLEIRRDETTGQKKYGRNLYSIQYRIPERLLHNPNGIRRYKKQTITDHCTLKAIYNLRDSFIRPDANAVFQPLTIHHTMFDMLKEFCFDIEKAELYLARVATGELEGRCTKSGPGRDLSALMLNMEAFNEGSNLHFNCDLFGERFHSPITNLWSPAMSFLLLKNSLDTRLVSIDFANSQPYFASIATSDEFINLMLPEFEPYRGLAIIQSLQDDYKQFAELCAQGRIYEHWAAIRNISRDQAKTEMMYIMFSKNRYLKNATDVQSPLIAFKENFPSVYASFCAIKNMDGERLPFIKDLFVKPGLAFQPKKSYYQILSCMMQRAESRMVRKIAGRMLDENIRPFLTVHDSFILPCNYADRAKSIINETFLEMGMLPPTVKTEFL